ncbi:MAG: long-chain fatty acid--CoA ligase, partial [Deltaproteobacteria bacterium]|nr:long-chain fatty acid--CoA ligase [Deltaproteobacteria bacterium]
VNEADEILSFLPLCHIGERNISVFCAMICGWVVNFSENLEAVPENIREISPHTFFAVPRFWEKFYSSIVLRMKDSTRLEKKVFDWSLKVGEKARVYRFDRQRVPLLLKLKYALAHFMVYRNLKRLLGLERTEFAATGAAPISPDILKFYHAVGIPIREVYGQTESAGVASMHQGDEIKLGTVGKPLPGVEIKIAEDNEILIKGELVFQGYYGNQELTNEYVRNGWLYTGDVGEIDEEGYLIITDRKKDIIITSGGKNITPSYIENKLKFSPYINDAVVIGDAKKYLTALIMIDKENVTQYAQDNRIPFTTYKSLCHNEDIIELIQQEVDKVNKTLAQVEKLKKFRLIDVELTNEDPELTATMKLKRKYVSEHFGDIIAEMY